MDSCFLQSSCPLRYRPASPDDLCKRMVLGVSPLQFEYMNAQSFKGVKRVADSNGVSLKQANNVAGVPYHFISVRIKQ